MKTLNREFTLKEKILLLILVILLLGAGYYFFVDEPVRSGLVVAESEQQSLKIQLDVISAKVKQMKKMQNEMDSVMSKGFASRMESYNNIKEEIKLLNDILASSKKYDISFSDVTRKGNQIRREVMLRFTAADYETVKDMIKRLSDSPFRCLIGEINVKSAKQKDLTKNDVTVSLMVTFYETMVDGEADAGLPADTEPRKEK